MSEGLTHFDEFGHARMVDVGSKPETPRVAAAEGELLLSEGVVEWLTGHSNPKGDAFTVAKVAGLMAAKRTSELIPLCHPIALNQTDITFHPVGEENKVIVRATAQAFARTGVEMEALTAASVALLTLYDMVKSVAAQARISNLRLAYKEGGKSGVFREG